MRTAVETWMAEPLTRFVDEARVQLALVLEPSGKVLAQHGFSRSVDVMSACALTATIHAGSTALGSQLDQSALGAVHHDGGDRQLYLAPIELAGGPVILLTVFDGGSSLGLVRLYFGDFCARLTRAARSAAPPARPKPSAAEFEQDLNHNLAVLFGRA